MKTRAKKAHWSEILRKNGACAGALRFARKYRTLQEAWDACPRPDWMNWLLSRIESDKQVPRRVRRAYAEIVYDGDYWYPDHPNRNQLLSSESLTWTEMARRFEPAFALGCDAIRRVFPHPPRFRNGAGE